jgi:HlyD family secretion protein
MKENKILKILAPLTVVLIIFAIVGKKQGWFGQALTIKVSVETVEKRSIIETITANGRIQPEREVKISPDVSGEIVELHVREGDQVEKGKLLFRIKPDNYVSMRDRAEAALSSARARLAQTEAQFIQSELAYKRNSQLFNEKTISEAEFEQSQASYKVAKAEVDAARFSIQSSEASLKEARENLTKTTVYAPISGTVSALFVELGERVVGTEMMSGTEVLRIADLSRMEARVDVNENDIVKVKPGDTAIINVDAFLGEKFRGIVTEIANSPKSATASVDQITNFGVKIRLLKESYQHLITERNPNLFRPGMSTSVDIQTETRSGIITVPIQSVTTRTDTTMLAITGAGTATDTRTLVFISDGTYALAKDVKTGIQDNSFIEIVSGIDEGVQVISAPFTAISKKLSDSTLIEVVAKEDLFKTGKK